MSWIIKEHKYFGLYEVYSFTSEEDAIKYKFEYSLKGEIKYIEDK